MSNAIELVQPSDVATIAAALWSARRGADDPEHIDAIHWDLFEEIVGHARVVYAALGGAGAGADDTPQARKRGPLNAVDVSALGNDLGADSVLILARDHAGHPTAAAWAVGHGAGVFEPAQAFAIDAAFTQALRSPTPEAAS